MQVRGIFFSYKLHAIDLAFLSAESKHLCLGKGLSHSCSTLSYPVFWVMMVHEEKFRLMVQIENTWVRNWVTNTYTTKIKRHELTILDIYFPAWMLHSLGCEPCTPSSALFFLKLHLQYVFQEISLWSSCRQEVLPWWLLSFRLSGCECLRVSCSSERKVGCI